MKRDGGFGETTWGDGNSAKNLQLNALIVSTWPTLGLTRRGGRLKDWKKTSFNLTAKNMQVGPFSGTGRWRGMNWRKRSAGRLLGLSPVISGCAVDRLLERRSCEAVIAMLMRFRPVSLLKSPQTW